MRKFSVLIAILVMTISAFAQKTVRDCGTTDYMQQQLQLDPTYKQNLQQLEDYTKKFAAENPQGTRTVYTIPVVVHVVYNTTTQNISDAQVLTQIDVLNQDFRRLNPDVNETPAAWVPVAADCEINFCLAAQDPSGNATSGITRTSTTKTSFSTNNNVKFNTQGGENAWDRNKYLNLWVCNLSGTTIGYATFPGGAANVDGVVIDYTTFGTIGTASPPFHLGRTATHEIGHWLNLFHIWGDDGTGCNGSDQVADTPNQADQTFGCPLPTIRISCTNGPNGDMYPNYMDYTDDGCMDLFTLGQKTRMQAAITGTRSALLTSPGCTPPGGETCNTPSGLNASAITTSSATLNWSAATNAISYNIQYRPVGGGSFTTTTSSTTSKAISGLSSGTQYEFQVQTVCSGGTSAFSGLTTFTTTTPTCTDVYEPNNSKGVAKPISTGVTINAKIGTATDKDFFSFTNSASQPNISVSLSSMPVDYDIDLFQPNGTKVSSSQNAGTEDELMVYNTSTVGTYKVRVYSGGGEFNNSDCYDLLVQIGNSPFRTTGLANNEKISGAVTNIFPNPSKGNMTIQYNSSANSSVQMLAYDLMGRIIFNQESYATEGTNSFSVNIHDLAPGVYVFEIKNGTDVSRMKFSIEK
jgi:hypothetical protein